VPVEEPGAELQPPIKESLPFLYGRNQTLFGQFVHLLMRSLEQSGHPQTHRAAARYVGTGCTGEFKVRIDFEILTVLV
jgi:hypothetical protein